MIEQTLFIKLKLVDDKGVFDGAKINATLAEMIIDPTWKTLFINTAPKCLNESHKYVEEYQKLSGIPKETCDFKYDIFSSCMDIYAFMVSIFKIKRLEIQENCIQNLL